MALGPAAALPATRDGLPEEILPLWLQHCLLGAGSRAWGEKGILSRHSVLEGPGGFHPAGQLIGSEAPCWC